MKQLVTNVGNISVSAAHGSHLPDGSESRIKESCYRMTCLFSFRASLLKAKTRTSQHAVQSLDYLDRSLTDNARSSVSDLVILRLRKLHHQLGDLVVYVHVLQDGSAVVRHHNIAVRTHHHLVKSLGTQRGLQGIGDAASCQNVRLFDKEVRN